MLGFCRAKLAFLLPGALLCLGISCQTRASGADWSLDLGSLEAAGVVLEGARVQLGLAPEDGQPDALAILVDRLVLPGGLPAIDAIRIDCAPARLHGAGLQCTKLQTHWQHDLLPQKAITGRLRLDLSGDMDLELRDIELAGGRAQLRFQRVNRAWSLDVDARQIKTESLRKILHASDLFEKFIPESSWSSGGHFEMSLHARGTGADTQHAEGRLDWREGAFADTHGLVAGEDLRARLSWKIDRHGAEQGQGRFTLLWDQGGAYVHPAYIEANPEQPLSLSGNLRWRGNRLSMDELSLQWGDRLALSGMGSMDMSAGASGLQASLQLQQLRFPESYDELLQSFLYATPLDDLQTQGQISGQLRIEAGRPVAASLSIDDMHMDDRKGRLGLYGLEGQLFWDASDAAGPSHLEWSGGHVYRVPLGASSLAIQSRPDGFSMLEPAIIPILDGSLRLDSLRADGISRGQPILELDAQLTPISMTQLAAHLNMPSFAGTLAGSLPGARFEQGRLSMDGVLRVAAFDGEIRMANPSLEDPFGVAPVLTADMEIDDLDLASVTSTFAFGLIEGILRGHVDDLVLVNWQPVNFDAVLYTPLDRQFRRRISQRALDNLVSVGGGPGGALSMGLLRFFDSFGYHQLGISCNLRGDVCEMNGVAPTTDGLGYYIVRGSGLPRVEVIGHTRDVAWRDLLTRLQAALDTPEISSSASPGESGQDRISLQH